MKLNQPIDINAVINTAKKYDQEIRTLDKLDIAEVLKYFKMRPGVKNSVAITEAQHDDGGSGKYTGSFNRDRDSGKLVPRDLNVWACVHEVSDEPERYRTTYLSETLSGKVNPNTHPFERWLIEFEIGNASENLFNVFWTATRSDEATDVDLEDAFNGPLTILRADKTASKLTIALKNLYKFSAILSSSNIGDQLLAMWRSSHETMKRKGGIMFMSTTHAEMYDDWYKANHDAPPAVDTAGQMFLDGSNGKCQIIRMANMPYADDEIILTVQGNGVWGTDDPNDMKNLVPFPDGPYLFSAAMKYVFGFQWESIHHRKLIFSTKHTT
jgi:hypothetical protein